MFFTLGIDYGTNSVRTLVVNCTTGAEVASFVVNYPSGEQGVLLDRRDTNLARQNAADYLFGLELGVRGALAAARKHPEFSPDRIIGVGVDSTGSSPIPVNEKNIPLALDPQWSGHMAAQCWLWKDHTSHREARDITRLAALHRPHYIAKCGNTYSSEWWWSKIWNCLKVAPEVFDAAFSWVELCDFIPSVLAGVDDPRRVRRGICAAGHKALYCDEWGGLPDKEFLSMLDPKLAALRDRLYDEAHPANAAAGYMCDEWAQRLGLPSGIPIAVGAFDVHYGAIGCGIDEGVLVKVIGTSTCDCMVVSNEKKVADIPGICGIVDGSILPGFYGIEAGQSAVGDIFKWFVEGVCAGDSELHHEFSQQAASLIPGASGLLALDWNNGNRTILVDPLLSGMMIGQTLHTTRAEIYRALIEATAFGARKIIARVTEYGVAIQKVICCGGIAEKNRLLMQVYADILGCEMIVAGSSQTCALGSAVVAAVVAGRNMGGFDDFPTAQRVMTPAHSAVYRPNRHNKLVYDQLYELYSNLHDAFGGVTKSADLSSLMKRLLQIRETATLTAENSATNNLHAITSETNT